MRTGNNNDIQAISTQYMYQGRLCHALPNNDNDMVEQKVK